MADLFDDAPADAAASDPAVEAADTPVDAVLDGPVDSAGFRRQARALLAAEVHPLRVRWSVRDTITPGLFDAPGGDPATSAVGDARAPIGASAPAPRVPATFAALADTVILHSDESRFALLYRMLWRLRHEPGHWSDTLDADRVRAEAMARVVRRDQHKMKAFVRFRPIERGDGDPPLHVAWFEPDHHVVESVAPFFARRFTQMCWSVLTPRRSVSWDGRELTFAAGASRDDAPSSDAGEALWLTYYENIFNPARLKMSMMQREMPRRYWKNLPEAVLIAPLAARADERSTRMVDREPTGAARYAAAANAGPAARRASAAASEPPVDEAGDVRPATLDAAHAAAGQCRRCPLYRGATQVVFGEGPGTARLMFVGEQPGDQEDLQGRPFVGPAGRLFDRALAQLGIPRDRVYVTNAVKHFKYEMRGRRRIHKTPSQQEAAACLDWLDNEIELVAPKALVALGATAARSLLGRPVAVTKERGQWIRRDDGLPVLVTLHPSALLRLPPEDHDAAVQRWIDDLDKAKAPPD